MTSQTTNLTVQETPELTHETAHSDHAPETDPPAHVYPEGVPFGLAMLGGGGLTLAIIALSVGAVFGENADQGLIGLLFAGGLLAFISATVAWFGYVQPHKHFDDITQPLYHGHAHHETDHADDDHHAAPADHAAPAAHH